MIVSDCGPLVGAVTTAWKDAGLMIWLPTTRLTVLMSVTWVAPVIGMPFTSHVGVMLGALQ